LKLTDLHPQFLGAGGEGVFTADGSPAPRREGVGLLCDCPCGKCTEEWDRLFVAFANPLDGGPPIHKVTWQRTGDTFETLTLTPSILRSQSRGGCNWHGFITNGEVITC
jgi:uncharacterized protein DUF6527